MLWVCCYAQPIELKADEASCWQTLSAICEQRISELCVSCLASLFTNQSTRFTCRRYSGVAIIKERWNTNRWSQMHWSRQDHSLCNICKCTCKICKSTLEPFRGVDIHSRDSSLKKIWVYRQSQCIFMEAYSFLAVDGRKFILA